jgi:hypothetical protein
MRMDQEHGAQKNPAVAGFFFQLMPINSVDGDAVQ